MFEFESTMKLIVALGTAGVTFILIGLGIKVLFFRRPPAQLPGGIDPEHLEGLEDRLLQTEAKVSELEERLDFAERMLTEVRGRPQLPGKP